MFRPGRKRQVWRNANKITSGLEKDFTKQTNTKTRWLLSKDNRKQLILDRQKKTKPFFTKCDLSLPHVNARSLHHLNKKFIKKIHHWPPSSEQIDRHCPWLWQFPICVLLQTGRGLGNAYLRFTFFPRYSLLALLKTLEQAAQ